MYKIRQFGKNLIQFHRKKLIAFTLIFISLLALVIILKNLPLARSTEEDGRFTLPAAKATYEIQREIIFPLKDAKGETVSNIKYKILNTELQDQIISKGKKYTTVKGRTILILNLKITNEFDKAIEINTRDYVRLSVGMSEEWLAADIHNDPVAIQPISTKYTRLGFPINDDNKNLRLQVGEINESKEIIEINF